GLERPAGTPRLFLLQTRIGEELYRLGTGRFGFLGLGHPGRQLAGYGVTTLIQGVGITATDTLTVGYAVHLEHADGVHLAACRADCPGNEAFDGLIAAHAASPVRPL